MQFGYLQDFLDRLTSRRIPGNAVSVWLNGEEVFRGQSGFADVERGVPMTSDRMFQIYSCSKVATVTAGAQLLERGLLLLDDPVGAYLPAFSKMNVLQPDGSVRPAEKPITVRHLFTMTAGFNYDITCPAVRRARELTGGRMNTRTVVDCLAAEPLSFEPGAHWQYSLCHDVLAGLIETVSGKRFRDYMRENLFEPLGMNETFYHLPEAYESRMAEQYRFEPDGSAEQDMVVLQSRGCPTGGGTLVNVGKTTNIYRFGAEYDSGGAGIVTSVGDYAKLCSALACGGRGATGERILSSAAVDLMRQNQLNPVQLADFNWSQLAGCGYGLGVRTNIDRARGGVISSVGEFGWGGAAGATVIVDPERRLGVFYAHHMLNPQEDYYQPRLRNVVYACLDE